MVDNCAYSELPIFAKPGHFRVRLVYAQGIPPMNMPLLTHNGIVTRNTLPVITRGERQTELKGREFLINL